MDYFEAPEEYDEVPAPGWRRSVFLAGGITDCPDWQAEARQIFAGRCVVLNPRRADFPIGDPSAAKTQIDWEYRHLRRADVVLFWFPESPSVQPIALYELGFHAAAETRIVVGTAPGYLRRADVVIQLRHARPEVLVRSTLEETCASALRVLDDLRLGGV